MCSQAKAVMTVMNSFQEMPTAINKWNAVFLNLNWKEIFTKSWKISTDTRLKWFQIRLLHRILATNKFLYTCKIVDSPLCSFCKAEEETLLHLFWDCKIINKLWTDFEQMLKTSCTHCEGFAFSKQLVLFGIEENVQTDKAMDFIILVLKFYIYRCRVSDILPSSMGFCQYLKQQYLDEMQIAKTSGNYHGFLSKWMLYNCLFEDAN